MSSTSGSRSQPSPVGRRRRRRRSPSPRYQTGIWWPHHSWREMHHGRMFSIQSRYTRRSSARGGSGPARCVTASIAGSASSSIRMNHCSEIERLDPLAGAVRERDRVRVRLGARDQPLLAQLRDDRRAAPRRPSGPANRSGASSVIRPSSPITLGCASPWRRPISKSLGSWPGRDLQRAGAELGLDVLVGDDLQLAPDERQDRLLADQPPVALVVGMDRDRGVGEHRLGPHGRDRDRAASPTRAGSRCSRGCR